MTKNEKEAAILTRDERVAALRKLGHSGAPEKHSRGLLRHPSRFGLVYEKTAANLLSVKPEQLRRLVLPEEWIANPAFSTAPKVPVYDPRTLLTIKDALLDDPTLAARGQTSVMNAREPVDAEVREEYREFTSRARDWHAVQAERRGRGADGLSRGSATAPIKFDQDATETSTYADPIEAAKSAHSVAAAERVEPRVGHTEALRAEGEAGCEAFDPRDERDGRRRVLTSLVQRQGQTAFRRELLRAYGRQCAITGWKVEDVLEAAHILPYRGPHTNHVSNGLLLRSDLHVLFDLNLIGIDADTYSVL